MEVHISEFRPEDYQQVYQVWEKSGLEMRTSDTLEELQKVRDRDPDLFLVARAGEKIVGAVLGTYDGRRGWVYHLGVDPAFQGMGIGTKLMEKLIERYRDKQVCKVNLMVTADNMEVCEFYKKLGFIKHDYIVMGLPLQGKY